MTQDHPYLFFDTHVPESGVHGLTAYYTIVIAVLSAIANGCKMLNAGLTRGNRLFAEEAPLALKAEKTLELSHFGMDSFREKLVSSLQVFPLLPGFGSTD